MKFAAFILFVLNCALSEQSKYNRIDCYPEINGETAEKCQARGCLWDADVSDAPTETPKCFYPNSTGYTKTGSSNTTIILEKLGGAPNPFGTDFPQISLTTNAITDSMIELSIGTPERFVPPLQLPRKKPKDNSSPLTFKEIHGENGTFAFQVIRKSTGTVIWDTSIGGLLFADKFIQIATLLPSDRIFGFGEHIHQTLKHDMTRYTTWPMFATGFPPDSFPKVSTHPLYGVHPFYICVESDGNAHGVVLLNSNAQEVTLGPAPHLVYRTIGGQLSFVFFSGPTPEAVIQGYLSYIGKPFLPGYWSFGYQLSRWGYGSLDDVKTVISRNLDAQIPLETVVIDIDYMNGYQDFTYGTKWQGLPAYIDELHSKDIKLVLIFDPAIEADYDVFARAIQQNVSFIEWPRFDQVPRQIQNQFPMAKDTKIMLGNVWPERSVGFPDFLDPTNHTLNWWISEFVNFRKTIKFDGIWIDMNEPENFQTGKYDGNPKAKNLECFLSGNDSVWDKPPFETRAVYNGFDPFLASKTLCLNGVSMRGGNVLYNTKSLYGWSEARATALAHKAAIPKRGFVLSRSTFVSSGRYTGHWLGDNTARWEDLRTSVIGAIEFNFFGIPFVGSDICGFTGLSWEELCLRWHQMGAFHPFSRDHNMRYMTPQDPAVWPSVTKIAKIVLAFKYRYLPFLYSLHYRAAQDGATVIRPLFFEFPNDAATFDVNYQFLWGSALMIAPALYPGVNTVHAYFPNDTWYSLQEKTIGSSYTMGYYDVPAANDSLTPVFVRGGKIVPRQTPSLTTAASRKNPFELLIAVAQNEFAASTGELFVDDGESQFDNIDTHLHFQFTFTYTYTNSTASLIIKQNSIMQYAIPTLDIIEIVGYNFHPDFTSFQLNGHKVNINVQTSTYNAFQKRLFISTGSLINLTTDSSLIWRHS